jgi:uncharacterized membrane protein YoaK (UPF0700 family)
MFTHHGHLRTHSHNLKIATLLSFVAGFVNVTGFIAIQKLTTNVTGHFAFFVGDIYHLKFYEGAIFFIYIFSFFFGAFVYNTLVEVVRKRDEKNIFLASVAIEIMVLLSIALFGQYLIQNNQHIIAVSLLFAMGLQNSLVTKISNAVVRTTHLTGLFTDLGIEISQLIFYKTQEQRKKLKAIIHLRMRIITFFFFGGIAAGFMYKYIQFYALFLPVLLLIGGLAYDKMKVKFKTWTTQNN